MSFADELIATSRECDLVSMEVRAIQARLREAARKGQTYLQIRRKQGLSNAEIDQVLTRLLVMGIRSDVNDIWITFYWEKESRQPSKEQQLTLWQKIRQFFDWVHHPA
jgi:hypothetical protein